MRTYARWLFGTAAVFNLLVAFNLVFLRYWVQSPSLHLDPIGGTNLVFANLAGVLIGTFGYAYARVAGDPVTFRPYIHLGAVGKLLAVACTVWPWWIGAVPWTMLAPVGPDLIYALLFLDFLRRTKAAR
ncbi:MAG: hypothetical protein ABSA49_15450 [Rhizomicrobium sp.]|jgi:hypothetical protein